MKEKNIKINELEVPIDITGREYKILKENLELFNNDTDGESKLTFDEFVTLVFETASLEEKLDSKYDYMNVLKAEIQQLEEELATIYSTGLTHSKEDNNEIIKSRKNILKDSSTKINGLY